MYIRLISAVLSCAFVLAILGQQVTPSPHPVVGPAIITGLCLFVVVGLLVVRRWVLPRLRVDAADSEFTGAMLQSVMGVLRLGSGADRR